jgi:hypothetical protein
MSKDTKDEIELRCIDCGETSVLSQTGNVSPEASAAAGKHDAAGVSSPGLPVRPAVGV